MLTQYCASWWSGGRRSSTAKSRAFSAGRFVMRGVAVRRRPFRLRRTVSNRCRWVARLSSKASGRSHALVLRRAMVRSKRPSSVNTRTAGGYSLATTKRPSDRSERWPHRRDRWYRNSPRDDAAPRASAMTRNRKRPLDLTLARRERRDASHRFAWRFRRGARATEERLARCETRRADSWGTPGSQSRRQLGDCLEILQGFAMERRVCAAGSGGVQVTNARCTRVGHRTSPSATGVARKWPR